MNCWVIAAACCMINFLILGIARLSPLLYVASMERYHVNRSRAAFPYVLCYIMRTFSGPIIGIVGRKYGLRPVTLFGCLASFIGIGACYFAEDIIFVTILWGGIYGFGCGFGTALLPIVLENTFKEKHKTKANGISLAGSSLGGVVIPAIIQASIAEYGLSGSFLVIAGLILHCVPACMLLSASNPKRSAAEIKASQQSSVSHSDQNDCRQMEGNNSHLKTNSNNSFYLENRSSNQIEAMKMPQEISKLNTKSLRGRDNLAFIISEENMLHDKHKKDGYAIKFTTDEYSKEQNKNSDKNKSNLNHKYDLNSIEPSGTPKLLQVTIKSENDIVNSTSCELKKSIDETKMAKNEIRDSSLRSLRIFADPTFLLIMFSQSGCAFNVMVVWTIVVDVARDKGMDRSSEMYCMMFLPFADLIGRVGLGWITDGGYLSKSKFCVISFLLLSLFTVLFVWVYSLVSMLLVLLCFGILSGGLIVVFPSVVCEHINARNKIMAMSCRLVLLAPLSLATSPLIAFFREQRGSYDGIFYVLFCITMACNVMSALIPVFSRRLKEREESEKT